MNKYKITLAYDGTDYFGWQYQPNKKSVTGTLQSTFQKVFGSPIKLLGASRTDAGVHANEQVAVFTTDVVVPCDRMLNAWNNLSPENIVIHSLEKIDDRFNPRFGVAQKTYWYYFSLERPQPYLTRHCYFFRKKIELEKLKKCLLLFVGMHDFRSFSTGEPTVGNTVKRIDSIDLVYIEQYNFYRIEVKGPGFLRHMIRRIVGACLHVASHEEIPVAYLQEVLDEKDAQQWLPKVSARGLVLQKIRYKS